MAAVSSYNRDSALLLACELLTESGPDFQDSAHRHAKMLSAYADYMRDMPLTGLAGTLSGKSRLAEHLEEAAASLQNSPATPENAARQIWRTGQEIIILRTERAGFAAFDVLSGRKPALPASLMDDAKTAIHEARGALAEYHQARISLATDAPPWKQEDPKRFALEKAMKSCEANRRTMLLLFFARAELNEDPNLLEEFQTIVADARREKLELAGYFPEGAPERKLLAIIADSEERRGSILDCMRQGQMDAAQVHIWKAIEESQYRRATVLELCRQIELFREPA